MPPFSPPSAVLYGNHSQHPRHKSSTPDPCALNNGKSWRAQARRAPELRSGAEARIHSAVAAAAAAQGSEMQLLGACRSGRLPAICDVVSRPVLPGRCVWARVCNLDGRPAQAVRAPGLSVRALGSHAPRGGLDPDALRTLLTDAAGRFCDVGAQTPLAARQVPFAIRLANLLHAVY